MSERWSAISGFEGRYEVSSRGRVRSLARSTRHGRRIKGRVMRSNRSTPYAMVTLCRDGRRSYHLVHRLMAEAFIPNPEGLPVVRHLNDDPRDNRLENLAWGTHSDNTQDILRNGNNAFANRTHCLRGHSLNDPNLANQQERTCLACARARASRASADRVGVSLQALSDMHYRKIQAGDVKRVPIETLIERYGTP